MGGLDLFASYVENNTSLAVDSIDGIYLGQSTEDLLFPTGFEI